MNIVISDVARDLIINIINIIILFVIVRSLAYKPIKKFLDERKARVEKLEQNAAEKEKSAKAIMEKYDKLLEDSKKESVEIIDRAEREAKENSVKIVENAKLKADEIINKARENMEAEHSNMISSMQDEITELAFDISKRILMRELNDDDNIKIAADFFSDNNTNAKDLIDKSVDRQKKKTKDDFDLEKENIASVAVDISEKILSRNINDEDNKKIAEKFFDIDK